MSEADTLILELLAAERRATDAEIAAIIAQVAQTPFASYVARVPVRVREDLLAVGVVCPARLPSIEWHLLERVYLDQQWSLNTTKEQYVADLHLAVQSPVVEIWTYRYFGRPYAGFIAPSQTRGAIDSERLIFVAYSPEFGTLTTGFRIAHRRNVIDANWTAAIRQR